MAKVETDRKEKIIEAALKLFIEKGAAFTRFIDVAKAAKVPAPLIHYYYQDMEDLHRDVTLKIMQELKEYNLREATKHLAHPAKWMREYVKGPLIWAKERPESLNIWLYFYYMSSRSKTFENLNTELRKGGRDRICLMIYRGVEQGVFKIPEGRTVLDLAYFIQSEITGHMLMFGCEKKDLPIDYYLKSIEGIVLTALGAQA